MSTMDLVLCVKRLACIAIIGLGFTHQASASTIAPMAVSPGLVQQDAKSYFYTGILAQLGYVSLNVRHPKLALYGGSTFSRAGVMLGLLVGRQMMEYLVAELTFEWLHSYAGSRSRLWGSSLVETDLSFYTLGVGLDCMPMMPVSDDISLLGIVGIAYKKANVEAKEEKIFDAIGGKFIPRVGVGVVIDGARQRVSLKLLAEFINLFKHNNQSIFKPSFLLGTSISINFK